MKHFKVDMEIFLKDNLNFVDDCVSLSFYFKALKETKIFAKQVHEKLNKNKEFITIGNNSSAYTLRIKDITDISYSIKEIEGE